MVVLSVSMIESRWESFVSSPSLLVAVLYNESALEKGAIGS